MSLRLQLAKSSIRKYEAMEDTVCSDGRARGCFQFYGANRSGRWAGRHIQLQNLPQNHLEALADVRELVRSRDFELLSRLYDNIPDVLSQLIRTAFVPKSGHRFIIADFSGIEARVLAFLAGEEWRNEAFRNNGDIYCASASAMFKVPVEKHGVNSHLRQKGKIGELALGYGGGKGALISMGALDMGLKEDELQDLVSTWRSANPHIIDFWWGVDAAAKEAIVMKGKSSFKGIGFEYRGAILYIHLPSGRSLCYVKPKIGENKFGGESITYEGIDANHKWSRIETYPSHLANCEYSWPSRSFLSVMTTMVGLESLFLRRWAKKSMESDLPLPWVCQKTPPWRVLPIALTVDSAALRTAWY